MLTGGNSLGEILLFMLTKKTNIKYRSFFSHIPCSYIMYKGNYKTENTPYKQ